MPLTGWSASSINRAVESDKNAIIARIPPTEVQLSNGQTYTAREVIATNQGMTDTGGYAGTALTFPLVNTNVYVWGTVGPTGFIRPFQVYSYATSTTPSPSSSPNPSSTPNPNPSETADVGLSGLGGLGSALSGTAAGIPIWALLAGGVAVLMAVFAMGGKKK
jgi:hypothetical protein